MQISKKKKQLFCSILNFKHFPKKMTLIADVFAELPAPKNMVR